jgi:hypothetical protein
MPNSAHNPLTDTDLKPAVNTASNLVSIAVTFRAMPTNYTAATQVSAMSRDMTVSDHPRERTAHSAVKRGLCPAAPLRMPGVRSGCRDAIADNARP